MLKMISPRMGISIVLLVVPLILGANVVSGADTTTPDTVLDGQWVSLMLEGKSFVRVNDVQLKLGGTPYQTYEGKVDNSWLSDQGIFQFLLSPKSTPKKPGPRIWFREPDSPGNGERN